LKITTALKQKASKVINAIVPKKKKKTLTGDMSSVSSTESITEQGSNKNSSSQPTVIDIDSDEGVEEVEEDPDAKLGKVTAVNLLTRY